MKKSTLVTLLSFLAPALSVAFFFEFGQAAEPDRGLLPLAERDAIASLEKLGASVILRENEKADAENKELPILTVIIDRKWTGADDDLKYVSELSTLQGLCVIGPGRVTNKALDRLRAGRPEVRIVRRPEVMLGIVTQRLPKGAKQDPEEKGVVIERVQDNSPAMRAGIRPGDRLIEFAGKPVPTFEALQEVMVSLEIGQKVKAKLLRDAATISVSVELSGWN